MKARSNKTELALALGEILQQAGRGPLHLLAAGPKDAMNPGTKAAL